MLIYRNIFLFLLFWVGLNRKQPPSADSSDEPASGRTICSVELQGGSLLVAANASIVNSNAHWKVSDLHLAKDPSAIGLTLLF